MKYRDVERALRDHGCRTRPGKGDHIVIYCPCGQHIAVAVTSNRVSAGVIGDLIKKLTCLPKGWLQ